MPDAELRLEREGQGDVSILRVGGSLNTSNSPHFREALLEVLEDRPPAVVVSMKGARQVDTSGAATVIECMRLAREYGGKLVLSGLTDGAIDHLCLEYLRETLPVFESEEQALKTLHSEQ